MLSNDHYRLIRDEVDRPAFRQRVRVKGERL